MLCVCVGDVMGVVFSEVLKSVSFCLPHPVVQCVLL